MGTPYKTIVPLEWNEANKLEQLIDTASKNKQALVIDPQRGVSHVAPGGLISPNENINGQNRFYTHYARLGRITVK